MKMLREHLARVRFRWHAFLAAFSVALPVLLDQLQVVDLKPLLGRYVSPELAAVLVALIPFYIAMLKPMIHFEDQNQHK